ncbi:MAG: ATP-binding protein [Patescibacteria group bacterium]|jgi:AAA15 family ATPase/GTPase|nr:ATP-binding protein [Patescibacteria group bacterium]
MITKIRVNNFYSIGEELEIEFTKGGTKEEKHGGYFVHDKLNKISLINGFYGANASGKSNVLKAMVTIIRLIFSVNNFKDIASNSLLCRPNMFKEFKNKPTKLGIDFLINNNYYKYDLEIKNGNKIVSEKLYITTLDKSSAKPKNIFVRNTNGIKFGKEYKNYENYLSVADIQDYQTFISHLINNVGAKALVDFKDYIKLNPFFLKTDSFDIGMPIPAAILKSAYIINSFNDKKKKEAIKYTKEIMSCFDDTIEDLEIKNESNNSISIKVKHKDFNNSIEMVDESAGTRELFCHIYNILTAFKSGGIVIYDEANRYFHPEIELVILSLFRNKEFNTKNAQLFFASHNHDTMDLLDIDQTFIVEKENSSSIVYKLSEVEDVKNRDNIKKKYKLGMFGGAPDVSLFDYKLKQLL